MKKITIIITSLILLSTGLSAQNESNINDYEFDKKIFLMAIKDAMKENDELLSNALDYERELKVQLAGAIYLREVAIQNNVTSWKYGINVTLRDVNIKIMQLNLEIVSNKKLLIKIYEDEQILKEIKEKQLLKLKEKYNII